MFLPLLLSIVPFNPFSGGSYTIPFIPILIVIESTSKQTTFEANIVVYCCHYQCTLVGIHLPRASNLLLTLSSLLTIDLFLASDLLFTSNLLVAYLHMVFGAVIHIHQILCNRWRITPLTVSPCMISALKYTLLWVNINDKKQSFLGVIFVSDYPHFANFLLQSLSYSIFICCNRII